MSKATSVFSLQATPQKSHRLALATFLAVTSLIAQVSYAECPAGQSPSATTGACVPTVTITGHRGQQPGNCDYGWQWDFTAQKCVSTTANSQLGQAYNNSSSDQAAAADSSSSTGTGTGTPNTNTEGTTASNGSSTDQNSQNVTNSQNVSGVTDYQKSMSKALYGTNGASGASGGSGANSAHGQCSASERLDPTKKYECDSTYNLIDNAKLTSQITQAAGGAAVNASGTVANIRAQNAGTQSAVAEATASTSEKAGMLQTALGIASAAIGAYEIKRSVDHKNYGKEIDKKRTQEIERFTHGATSGTTLDVYDTALGEQSKIEKTAMQAGAMAVYQGAVQASAGMMAIAAAKQAKELAGKLQNATGTSYQITSANPTDLTNTGTTSTAINPGTATDPAVATTDGNIKANDVPNISPPVNPDANPSGPGGGPVAGGFTPGSPQAAGGGGGNPGIGVGAMQAAKGDPEPTGPKMADTKGNSSYAQGSGAGFAAGGGVSAEKSADLGFLANLLPKPQEEMAKNGILDYGGGRSPASMAPYSFLGKDVNIFQRISDRTTAKFKSGDVGGI